MATITSKGGRKELVSHPKKTAQGSPGQNTKLSATSRNGNKKPYRGQGR
jgi:hypothetical protein